ncbi:MAG TPA: UDP-N-acetylglucosamine 1-carboxyvinyltransferase, partial [Patescibacteria group bacterium]|nr:UDP-N-acetylglucosamine 1-carboxyvinyltransferase [Patescibacteria group bacterium]
MEKFVIEGKQGLEGEIPIHGAKNHALKMIPACFLTEGTTTLHHVPFVEDILRMLEIVEHIGGVVKRQDAHTVEITPPSTFNGILPPNITPKLRASLVLLGPLL